MKYRDYYAALGVERGATEAQIKQAYRKLARKYHPDVSKEPNAEEKFKEIAEAYQTLKDPQKRAAYDQLGAHRAGEEFRPSTDWQQQWRQWSSGAKAGTDSREGGAENFADSMFGGEQVDLSDLFANLGASGARGRGHMPIPGQDFEITVPITIEQAYSGTEIDLNLEMPEYDQQGHLRRVPHAFKARIPKGATEGQRLRLPGQGGRGINGGRNGDLYINIRLQPHPLYRASEHDLYLDLPLAPWEAVLGTSVEVPTPAGRVRLKVPASTPAGQHLRLPRRGLPKPKGGQGDLFAIVQIVVPRVVGEREQALYRQLSEGSAFDPRAHFGQASGQTEQSSGQESGHAG